jgi:hypothetical protein
MKLNHSLNLRAEDFPTEQGWIGRFFNQINPFIAILNQIFDSNIDFATNIKSVTRDYTISTFQAFQIQWPYKDVPPVEVRITKALKGTQLSPAILLPAWNYDAATNAISIKQILEITEAGISNLSGKYTFTLRASI